MSFKLKEPKGYDLYEGEFIDGWVPEPAYRAIFRASAKFYDGIVREDKKVAEYVKRCKDANQKYGLYHFLLPNDISHQTDIFLSTAYRIGIGQMPLIIDVEIDPSNFGISQSAWQYQIKVFMDTVEKETQDPCVIYTSKNFWNYVLINGKAPIWTNSHALWIAQYPYDMFINLINAPSPLPTGWTHWDIWQYNDSGRSYGYPNNDYNVFSQDYKVILDAKWGNGNTPIPPTPQPSVFPSDIYIGGHDYKLTP